MANVLKSKRVQVLGALMLASGMPLGFVFNTFQIFLRSAGVDLKTIGILSAVSIPWSLKFLWAPLVDRYALPRPDRRRSWIVVAQIALALEFFAFAAYAGFAIERDPATGGIALAASAADARRHRAVHHDRVRHPGHRARRVLGRGARAGGQGPASGLRVMWYRIGMLVAGALAIFSAQWLPWPAVFALLGVLFLASIGLTLWAEPPPGRQ